MSNYQLHYKALTDLVELMAVLGAFAVGVDLFWCISDWAEQQYSGRLVPIITALGFALISMVACILKYHRKLVQQYTKEEVLKNIRE